MSRLQIVLFMINLLLKKTNLFSYTLLYKCRKAIYGRLTDGLTHVESDNNRSVSKDLDVRVHRQTRKNSS